MRFLQKSGRVFDILVDVLLLLAGIVVFVQTLWITQDVIIRKAFNWTWAPSFEILSYSILWMTFMGTTAIYRDRGHVVMEAIVARFSARTADMINLITTAMTAGLLVFLIYYSARVTVMDYQAHVIMSSILKPPKWPIEMIIPIGMFFLFVQSLRHVGTYYRAYKSGEYIKAGEQSAL